MKLHLNYPEGVEVEELPTEPEDQSELYEALQGLGASCSILARFEGPRTTAFRVMPANGVTIARVKSRMADLAVRLETEYCVCREEAGRLYIELAKAEPEIPLTSEIGRAHV